jgi:ABC-2 type transport system ATP-binding protein
MGIEINGLSKLYADNRGLSPVSFSVATGELLAVIGHNGAGKSTLLKIVAGWHLPDSGTALVDGISVTNRLEVVRKIGFVPEVPNLFDAFSVEYNFKLFARLIPVPMERIEVLMEEFALLPFRSHTVRELSKGLRQRVSIARALLADPPILLFDEPTSGLDVAMTQEIYGLLRSCHASGKTIIFTSHRPEEITALATRVVVLNRGEVHFDGSPDSYHSAPPATPLSP